MENWCFSVYIGNLWNCLCCFFQTYVYQVQLMCQDWWTSHVLSHWCSMLFVFFESSPCWWNAGKISFVLHLKHMYICTLVKNGAFFPALRNAPKIPFHPQTSRPVGQAWWQGWQLLLGWTGWHWKCEMPVWWNHVILLMEEIRLTSWYGQYLHLFTGFHTYWVVQDFFHQQYDSHESWIYLWKNQLPELPLGCLRWDRCEL